MRGAPQRAGAGERELAPLHLQLRRVVVQAFREQGPHAASATPAQHRGSAPAARSAPGRCAGSGAPRSAACWCRCAARLRFAEVMPRIQHHDHRLAQQGKGGAVLPFDAGGFQPVLALARRFQLVHDPARLGADRLLHLAQRHPARRSPPGLRGRRRSRCSCAWRGGTRRRPALHPGGLAVGIGMTEACGASSCESGSPAERSTSSAGTWELPAGPWGRGFGSSNRSRRS